jgi:AraC-like DNA-binding protein
MATQCPITAYSRYLPVEPDALAWGLHVLDAGYTEIPPHSPYPPGKHPEGYMFQWDKGRVLSEHQLVYVTRGEGVFESRSAGKRRIRAGTVFLLFPDEWHRYSPSPATGWDESWVGFDGDHARRVMSRFFSRRNPVLDVGCADGLLSVFRSIAEEIRTASPGYRPIVAARTLEILALIRRLTVSRQVADNDLLVKVQQARCTILAQSDDSVDLRGLSRDLGMSYSSFRNMFKRHTGSSPRQYHIQIRLNKAKAFLTETDMPVSQIAARTGFSSAFYFSRLFKRRVGQTPMSYRRRSRSGRRW